MKLVNQSLAIIAAIATIFIVNNTVLIDYIAQILGVLIIFSLIYIIIKKRGNKDKEVFVGSYLEFFTITVAILLTIFLTDGFHSNLFFLAYFLLFGISFMFEPPTVFLFMAGLLLLFLPQALQGDIFVNLIRLSSFLLLAPIAFFFGREFKKRDQLNKSIEQKTDKIIEDVDKIVESENTSINQKDADKLDDIQDQANKLREETKEE